MRNLSLTVNLLWITFVFLVTSCAPAASIAPTPTESPTRAPSPTATRMVILEDPPACSGANMIYHSQLQEVLLIGCIPSAVRQSSPNIIWGWNGERWRRVTEGGPQMLLLGGAAYDEQRNAVVIYGGYSWAKNSCERETWEWDGEAWSQKEVESPTACDHLKMVYDASRGEVILFGGGDENQNLSTETWSWNGEVWKMLGESDPPGRAHFGFVYDPVHEQGLVYGGYSDRIMDDFWTWRDGEWEPIGFPGPGPLSHFGMASDHDANVLLIFGGASSTSTFSSLSDKTWKLANGAWSELSLADHPSTRGSPAMVYDATRKQIVLYGGFASDRSELNDTWEWNGTQWQCVHNCQQ
ncbi:MAG TPA: hypothetical protein VFY66_04220 [Anaerolineales bacterium]|nr:hypothetical protein [Anaerolineales bacterium]